MRNPELLNKFEINTNNIIKIDMLPEFNIQDYDFNDSKDTNSYIEDVKKIVRGSFEYRAMIRYLRENMNMNRSAFFTNVDASIMHKVKIEIHHDPFDLHSICYIIFKRRKANGESLDIEATAKEVMYVHYKKMVGLIPLTQTEHELVGNGYMFIPTTRVFGLYNKFVELYEPYMEPEELDTLERIETATANYSEENDPALLLLKKNFIYFDIDGAYRLPEMNEVANFVKERISEIRNAPTKINPIIKLDGYTSEPIKYK